MSRLLCVFCGSSDAPDPKYFAVAEALGRDIAGRGWGLVYGGGNIGLMGALARSVRASGGQVIGVIPGFMKDRELAYEEADELITVTTMRERKRVMEERASAFIALPGGIGTLEELTEIMVLRYLDLIHKPLVLLNQDGFYDDLLRFFEHLVREGFKAPRIHALLPAVRHLDEAWELLEVPPTFRAPGLWHG